MSEAHVRKRRRYALRVSLRRNLLILLWWALVVLRLTVVGSGSIPGLVDSNVSNGLRRVIGRQLSKRDRAII